MFGGYTVVDFASWTNSWAEYFRSGPSEADITLSDEEARIVVLTNTGTWDRRRNWTDELQPGGSMGGLKGSSRQVNVTECVLHNATYTIDFSFQYPNETRKVAISDWLNTVAIANIPTEREEASVSYLAIMEALGKMLVGNATHSHYGSYTDHLTNWRLFEIDWSDGEAVRGGLESLFQNITLSLLSDSGLT